MASEDVSMEDSELRSSRGRGRDRSRSRSRSPRGGRRSIEFDRSALLNKIGRAHKTQNPKRRLRESGEPRTEGDRGAVKSVGGYVLFVSGIHEESSKEDLEDQFAEFSSFSRCHVYKDRKGQIKDYALLEFTDEKDAASAVSESGNIKVLGKSLNVGWAFV